MNFVISDITLINVQSNIFVNDFYGWTALVGLGLIVEVSLTLRHTTFGKTPLE